MSELHEIELAVQQLPKDKLSEFRAWFAEFDAELWDRQIEGDVASGRLQHLADEALNDLREGRCKDL